MNFTSSDEKSPFKTHASVVEDRWEFMCEGLFQRSDALKIIDDIAKSAEKRPELKKCLLDFRNAEVSLGIMGEFIIGEYAAKNILGLRIALIQVPGQINKLFEDTAYNRGLRISMVETKAQALEWLNK